MSTGPARTVDQMEQDLRALIATVQGTHLRALLDTVLGQDAPDWPAFRVAPAAKHYHQAYTHGLLEHTLTVAQAVSALSAIFPGLDRDLALTGALLHDIGKLDTYETVEGCIEMTDDGRLHGEIALGYARIRDAIQAIADFPHEQRQALLHIILSHHGSLEHGSPVVPCTREATLVHMADNLGSKLGSFDRIERGLDTGAQWAGYDRGIGTSAYFGIEGAAPDLLARAA
ncbi:MAG TPA: HD domain-containing protein [Solirubrobacteraceae bacterium]|nr:HD domain-containing protein [Solirubrobacteraceae bacterium]